ncbi:MAG: SufD family Fe-S cluster assembly protein [Corynebacterium sp.]|uniref:SufB/SufD family protein n=1 Tax=Corynebacterium sp. TaxID=1720 RepID=UPI0026DB81D4|nr:SufD family Fe-S cluster assembly protein [Corynebacterium sp.]MDO4760485.1 SufD family Fe-S cluster assembly protein [Corynebacterium sp.]
MTQHVVPVHAGGIGPKSVTPDLLAAVGWLPEEQRSGTSIMVDHGFAAVSSNDPDVVVMPLAHALIEYPWVQQLVFSQISPEEDEIMRRAFESTREPLGTFTWIKDGAKVSRPTQSFTVMTKPQERQFVHDITVIGKNAVVDHVSGSAVAPALTHATHVSVQETFIGDGAVVRSIDVDRWGEQMTVHSYDRTSIGQGAKVSSVSVAVSGLKQHVSDSVTKVGAGSAYTSHSIVFAPNETVREINSVVELSDKGAQAEQVSRMVADGGTIINRSTLKAAVSGVKGFLECDGLMLAQTGRVESVPALDAMTAGAQLSHEASVGMIDDEKLDYLRALGLDEDHARDLIVQGFLNLDDQRIPQSVRRTVEDLVSAARGAEKM